MGEFFNLILINPIINILVAVYKLLLLFGTPYTLGFAIILLTVLLKLLIYPLTTSSLQSMKKMQALKPHLERIKERYKNDKSRQQQEIASLFKQHNVNPAGGCLPLFIQFLIPISLYTVFIRAFTQDSAATMEEINKILYFKILHLERAWDPNFFGISLAATPLAAWKAAPLLLAIPIMTAVFQFVQSKMMMPATEQNKTQGDFQKIMQTQMLYFFPFMIGFFSFTFPVGLSVYWNTFTVFAIIQQYLLNKNVDKKSH